MKLKDGSLAAIDLPPSMTAAAWDQMLKILDALKDGYISEPTTPVAPSGNIDPEMRVDDEEQASSSGLTAEAQELLAKVENGGVPAYTTGNLEQIAEENGIQVAPDMTPNEIIEALLQKSLDE
jgi:hypothetical protein